MNLSLLEQMHLRTETKAFIGIILILTAIFHTRFNARSVAVGPTILTTIGIFATFLGIAVALTSLKTGPDQLKDSIPFLLEGLKTAFWASVFGVGCALTIKIRDYIGGHKTEEGDIAVEGEVTAADLLQSLHAIQKGLVGSDEGTLLSQIKLSRTDSNDRLDRLKEAQVAALQEIAKMGSGALIEALKDVIRDFNQKISDQFGENFKELNQAVGKLLEWQNQYKQSIEQTNRLLEDATTRLDKATKDYALVIEQSGKFAEVANGMGHLIITLNDEKDRYSQITKELAELLKAASGSMPEVEKKMVEIGVQLSNSIKENQQNVQTMLMETGKSLFEAISKNQSNLESSLAETASKLALFLQENQKTAQNALTENAKLLSEGMTSSQHMLNKSLTESSSAMRDSMEKITKDLEVANTSATSSIQGLYKKVNELLEESHQESIKSLRDQSELIRQTGVDFNNSMREANEECNNQFRERQSQLDAALKEELKASLQGLAGQLTILSQQFVNDYTPLTARLREIVQMTSRE